MQRVLRASSRAAAARGPASCASPPTRSAARRSSSGSAFRGHASSTGRPPRLDRDDAATRDPSRPSSRRAARARRRTRHARPPPVAARPPRRARPSRSSPPPSAERSPLCSSSPAPSCRPSSIATPRVLDPPAPRRDGPSARSTTPRSSTRAGRATRFVRAALGLTQDEARAPFASRGTLPTRARPWRASSPRSSGALRRSACLELIAADVTLERRRRASRSSRAGSRCASWRSTRGAREFGLAEPRGMLVCGVQGCGKSLVSKAAAARPRPAARAPRLRRGLRRAVARARDPRGHARGRGRRSGRAVGRRDREGAGRGPGRCPQARVFGAFLTWLQERRAPVFVAATANEVERLPPELARRGRFDEVFFVDLPSTKERAEILSVHLRRRGRDPEARRSTS